ncbi:MAG TPA: hypothetical protein VFH48_27120 [Chloroflexota bacterium]|nr:hypothetical protein [Chloroflexota bacterium]
MLAVVQDQEHVATGQTRHDPVQQRPIPAIVRAQRRGDGRDHPARVGDDGELDQADVLDGEIVGKPGDL